MKSKCAAVLVVMMVCAIAFGVARRQHARATTVDTPPLTQEIPPLPAGVTELKFRDFFVQPVGDRGLEFTDTMRKLDDQRVRILGYMAQQDQTAPGVFLFNAMPVQLNEDHYGLAEDLPAATLFVLMPKDREKIVPHTPGLMLLTGTLSVGIRGEAGGRISSVRLALEVPESVAKTNSRSLQKSAERLARRAK